MSANEIKDCPVYPDALNTFNDAMRFAASRDSYEIKKSILRCQGEAEREIYLVALRGTDRSFDKTDVLSVPVCLRSFLAKDNIYLDAVKKGIFAEIPSGSTLVLIGHSLGGMIAQQVAADSEINAAYTVLHLFNIGSPYVPVKGRKCTFRRAAEKADLIPWLGISIRANLFTEKPVFVGNGYFGRPVAAHTDAYRDSESWSVYDCFGELYGKHSIVFCD